MSEGISNLNAPISTAHISDFATTSARFADASKDFYKKEFWEFLKLQVQESIKQAEKSYNQECQKENRPTNRPVRMYIGAFCTALRTRLLGSKYNFMPLTGLFKVEAWDYPGRISKDFKLGRDTSGLERDYIMQELLQKLPYGTGVTELKEELGPEDSMRMCLREAKALLIEAEAINVDADKCVQQLAAIAAKLE